jgi:hypothetical protein
VTKIPLNLENFGQALLIGPTEITSGHGPIVLGQTTSLRETEDLQGVGGGARSLPLRHGFMA